MIAADFNDTPFNGLAAAIQVRDKGVQFDAVCCDGENLPIADNSLDFTFICSALHHFTRPQVTLKEVFRVLKPGGQLVDICESYRTGEGDEEREAGYEPLVEFREAGINELSYTEVEYRQLFEAAGFEYSVYLAGWDAPDGSAAGPSWENRAIGVRPAERAPWKHALLQFLALTPAIGVWRNRKLHRTVRNRVIVARKPAVS